MATLIARVSSALQRIGTEFKSIRTALGSKLDVLNPVWTGTARGPRLDIDGAATAHRPLYYLSSGIVRWRVSVNNVGEPGSNGGSHYNIDRFDDAGVRLGTALSIARDTGHAAFSGHVVAQSYGAASYASNTSLFYADGNHTVVKTGAAGVEKYWRFDSNGFLYALSGGLYSELHVQTQTYLMVGSSTSGSRAEVNRGWIELRNDSNGFGPYIDFSGDASADYHARIAWNGGSMNVMSTSNLILSAGGSETYVYANGGGGVQAGPVLTASGAEQVVGKQLTFPSQLNPQDAGAYAPLEVRGGGGGYGAWMKFHRPGAYGTYFGMFEDGKWGFGGWSTGATIHEFWTTKNMLVDVEPAANTVAKRTASGKLKANSFVAHPGVDGVGYRYWQDDDSYGSWMSNANNTIYGGRVPDETTSDYNMYFSMAGGTNRGWNFKPGASQTPVAGIDAGGNGRFGSLRSRSEVYIQNWMRSLSTSGWYFESLGRGLAAPENASHSYGHISPYGVGRNSWHGYNIGVNNNACLMTDTTNQWGVYNASTGTWMMSSDMSGNVTFNGNVTAYSDLRLKELVGDGKITNVQARRDTLAEAAILYRRKDDPSRVRVGYGAQTLRAGAMPEVVHEADDALALATGTGTLSVDYGETSAVLAVASKETDDAVAALTARVAQLEQLLEARRA